MAYLDASSRPTVIVLTMAAARAIVNVSELAIGQSLFVASKVRVWYWVPGDVTVDDGTDNTPAIEPAGGTGRFLPQMVIVLGTGTIPTVGGGHVRADALVVTAETSIDLKVANVSMLTVTSGGSAALAGASTVSVTSTANDVQIDAKTDVDLTAEGDIHFVLGNPSATLTFDGDGSGPGLFIYPASNVAAAGTPFGIAGGDTSGGGAVAAGTVSLTGGYGNGALHTGGTVAIASGIGTVGDGAVEINSNAGSLGLRKDGNDVLRFGTSSWAAYFNASQRILANATDLKLEVASGNARLYLTGSADAELFGTGDVVIGAGDDITVTAASDLALVATAGVASLTATAGNASLVATAADVSITAGDAITVAAVGILTLNGVGGDSSIVVDTNLTIGSDNAVVIKTGATTYFTTNNGKPTITAMTSAIVDANAKTAILSIIDALKGTTGVDLALTSLT